MTTAIERVDAWCRRGDFTVEDVAWFRIIFGVAILLTAQQVGWTANVPARHFDPPPGPMMLLGGTPPHAALEALEIATLILTALLVLGLHTRAVSILLGLALMAGFGVVYSLGKIDHTIVVVLVPLTMAFSGWGGAMSIDARGDRGERGPGVAQWPVRLLALTIGLSFVTAGVAKLRTGWLDLDTHAVQGHFIRGYFAGDRTDWLASQGFELRPDLLWELADWFTVALELGLVLTVLSWRAFRLAIAVAALFHLGVLLLMNIIFSWNVLGYGAFVRWGTTIRPAGSVPLGPFAGGAVATLIGLGVYVLHYLVGPDLQLGVRTVIVFLGAVAVLYLASRAVRLGSVVRTR